MYILRIWGIYLENQGLDQSQCWHFMQAHRNIVRHQLSKVLENKGLHLDAWMPASMLFEMPWDTQDTHGVGRYHIGPVEAAAGDMETMQDTPGCLKWYLMPKHKQLNQVLKLMFYTEVSCRPPISNQCVSCRAAKLKKSYKRIASLFQVCWNLAELTDCVSLFCYEHIMLTEPHELLW